MVASKLRIDHVVSSLKGGGMEHFVIRLCEAQRRRGHDAAVLAIYGGPLLEIAAAKGVPVTVLRAGTLQRVAHAAEVRAELGLEGRVVGANVGSFFPVKAQDVLVRSVAELKKTGAPLTILFVGDGAERARVEKLAGDLGLDASDVRFLGFRNDVADILAASDFFVLPSRAEGLPLSILEAMSRALPVVCTAVGGNPELVSEGEQGYLVPVDDPGALAAAMGRLVADEGLRRQLGEAGRARVASEFSFERTTDRYENAYRRVLRGESQNPRAGSTAS
jgi:glycosyltransferase involved in cell wall biosynthesis